MRFSAAIGALLVLQKSASSGAASVNPAGDTFSHQSHHNSKHYANQLPKVEGTGARSSRVLRNLPSNHKETESRQKQPEISSSPLAISSALVDLGEDKNYEENFGSIFLGVLGTIPNPSADDTIIRSLQEDASQFDHVMSGICNEPNTKGVCSKCQYSSINNAGDGLLYSADVDCNSYVFPNEDSEYFLVAYFQYLYHVCRSENLVCESPCEVDVTTKRLSWKDCLYIYDPSDFYTYDPSIYGGYTIQNPEELLDQISFEDLENEIHDGEAVDEVSVAYLVSNYNPPSFESLCDIFSSIEDDAGNSICPTCMSSTIVGEKGLLLYNMEVDCDESASINEEIGNYLTQIFEGYSAFCDPFSKYSDYFVCETGCEVNVDAKSMIAEGCYFKESAFNYIYATHVVAATTDTFCSYYGAGGDGHCRNCGITYVDEGEQTNAVYDVTINSCGSFEEAMKGEYSMRHALLYSFYWICYAGTYCTGACEVDVDSMTISMRHCSPNNYSVSFTNDETDSLGGIPSTVGSDIVPGESEMTTDESEDMGDEPENKTDGTSLVTISLIVRVPVDLEAIEEKVIAVAQSILDDESMSRRGRQRRLYKVTYHRYLKPDQRPNLTAVATIVPASSCPEYDSFDLSAGSQCIVVSLLVEGVGKKKIRKYTKSIEDSVENGVFENELQEVGLDTTVRMQTNNEAGNLSDNTLIDPSTATPSTGGPSLLAPSAAPTMVRTKELTVTPTIHTVIDTAMDTAMDTTMDTTIAPTMAPTMAPTKAITKTPTKDPTPVPTIVPTATPTKARSTKTPTTTAPSANMISVKDTSTTSPSTNTPDISDSLTSNLDLVATDPCPGFADDCSRCVANPACSWCLETSVCFNANVEIEAAPVQNGDGSSIIARKFENQCFGTMTQLVSACPISSQNPSLGETEGGNYKATNLDADVDAEGNVGPDTNADDTLKGTHETTTSSSTAMNLDAANDENVDTDANARASFEGINETTDIAQSSSSSINTAGMLLASGVCCIATVLAMRHM